MPRVARCLPFLCLLFATGLGAPALAQSSQFPRPAELEPDVRFWTRIYTGVTTQGGLIHDDRFLGVIYEELRFPAGLAPKERSDRVDAAKEKYQRILRKLATGARGGDLSDEERRVLALWPDDVGAKTLLEAVDRVRFQLGQSDRFREGIVRAGAWEHHVEETLKRRGLPGELSALPHVESSFNPRAYSKVGAAGMWQFMPSTGRRWLRVDNVVDERLDPYKSTEAAAQYLQLNHSILGTWPLALTAYNHGAGGMRRAKEMMGTDDIVTIARGYQSRTFGFASRNFYVSFLAALDVDRNYTKYFGAIDRLPRDDSRTFRMPDYVPLSSLERVFAVDRDTLRGLNLALLDPVWSGDRYVPRGFELRVPKPLDPNRALAQLADHERFDGQKRDAVHRVKRGESLSTIARRHGTTVATLLQLNGLKSSKSLRAGTTLKLPGTQAAPPRAPVPAAAPEPAGGDVYVVKSGDTLTEIGRRVGMTEAELMKLNSIKDRNYIFEGQRLRTSKAPVPAAVVAANAPAAADALAPDDEPEEDVQEAEKVARSKPQPVSREQAAELGPALVPGIASAASADPTDYSVVNDTTVVQGSETLGHFAEWLDVSASSLRRLNGMKPGTALALGRRIKLDLSKVDAAKFEERRVAWHKQVQDEFFERFRITGQERYRLKAGESLWALTQRTNVPVWLLRQYNPETDFENVRIGTEIVLPRVEGVAPAPPAPSRG